MAVAIIGIKRLDAFWMILGGILSKPTVFLVSISSKSFLTLSTVVGLKENYLFLVVFRHYLIFDQFDAWVILVLVYNKFGFICKIYTGCGGDGFTLNATSYFNDVFIMTVKINRQTFFHLL